MRGALYIGSREAPADIDAIEPEALNAERVDAATMLLIGARDPDDAWSSLQRIRSHAATAVYLKPVVLLGMPTGPAPLLERAVDGHIRQSEFDSGQTAAMLDAIAPINRWIASLSADYRGPDTDLSFKLLRFIASRGHELEPLATTASPFGYLYPPIEPFMGSQHGSDNTMQVLDFLEAEHLLAGRFITKAHFCNQCGSAFLNFKEVCPDCAAEDVEQEEMLHHFRCGYTGEHAEFTRGSTLVCPKCERELRHVGVDYDKPSVVFRCCSCNRRFQTPTVVTTCFHCGRSGDPEDQELRPIRAHTITAMGANAALYGLENLLTRILGVELNVWPYEAFKLFVDVEQARISRYERSASSLAVLHLQGLDSVYSRMGRRTSELWEEISAVFRRVLRHSDVITARNESVFALVLTETEPGRARTALERIEKDIHELLKHNLGEAPRIDADIHPIEKGIDVDAVVEAVV